MKPKYKRLWIILATLGCFGAGTTLVLMALRDNVTYFYTPKQLIGKNFTQQRIRIGGYVKNNSVIKSGPGIEFIITDTVSELKVRYTGVVPDLFRDGQGVIAQGKLESGLFMADLLLAKHDENYTPPQILKYRGDK